MKIGKIVEYIEQRKIVCAVVLKADEKKLKVLTESNREIKLSTNRISHEGSSILNLSMGRVQLVELIKQIALKRYEIAKAINVKSLWNQTNKNKEWLGIGPISKLCFSTPNEHEEAAAIRACFDDRVYFKFKPVVFFPNSKEKISELNIKTEKTENDKKLINIGSEWIGRVINGISQDCLDTTFISELKEVLLSFYIHGKKSPHSQLAKKILSHTNLNSSEELFNFMVKIGVLDKDENLDIIRFKIPTKFSQKVIEKAKELQTSSCYRTSSKDRSDFTNKFTITIDGPTSSDFDDALSIERIDSDYLIGIHISDVSHYIKKNTLLDRIAFNRLCSIYTPDLTLPMIPLNLSEDILSLKEGKIRLSISTIVRLDTYAVIIDYKIFPSIIRVDKQLSYCDVNKAIEHCKEINILYNLAEKLKKIRMQNGATQIRLPELSIDFKKLGKFQPVLKKVDRESPSRVLVEEMMILSNWIGAQFLSKYKVPAIFRSQPEPRKQIIKNHTNSLFHNWTQKRMLRRMSLKTQAARHCVLGLNAYVTATSPIRKYSDLVTQRQIKSVMKIGQGYSGNEINKIISTIANNTTRISKIQSARIRYWILKHLEQKIGKKEKAIVLQKRYGSYSILLIAYMLECTLQQSDGIALEPKDVIQVLIQHISARNDVISVFIV